MSMTLIETIELGSSQASITFSSIPQDYTDLMVKASSRSDRAAETDEFVLRPNNSTTNDTSISLGAVSGNSSFSSSYANDIFAGTSTGNNATANSFGSSDIYISNYTSSSAKSISSKAATLRFGDPTNIFIFAGLWNDTTAISSLVFVSYTGSNFMAGTIFSLYGITAGSDGTTTVS